MHFFKPTCNLVTGRKFNSVQFKKKMNFQVYHDNHKQYIARMDMVKMSKRQQPIRNDKCQLKAIHGYSMNEEEIFTPKGMLQLAQKHECTYSKISQVN